MNLITDHAFLAAMLAYFVVVGPWLGRIEMAGLRRAPADRLPAVRRRAYDTTMILLWVITAVLLGWWLLMGRGAGEIGLHVQVAGWQWLAVGLSLLVTAIFALYYHRVAGRPDDLAKVRGELGDLALMVPHDAAELRRFGWLSITAGVCEEILYRGLLMTALTAIIGLWPAVFASSLVFGIGHAYQGALGVLRTGAVGLVLALVVVLTGSLPAAMLMHAVIDLVQGRLAFVAVNAPAASAEPTLDAAAPAI